MGLKVFGFEGTFAPMLRFIISLILFGLLWPAFGQSPIKRGKKQPGEIKGQPINSQPPGNPAATDTNVARVAEPSAEKIGNYPVVGFDRLAGYHFEVSDDIMAPPSNKVAWASAKTAEQIPEKIKSLGGRPAAIRGFMLPLKVEGGLVTELLIMRDQSMCCLGTVPKINEWVSVKMTGKGVKPIMDQAVTLFGTLRVGEMRENNYLVGIYRMDGEKMIGPDGR